MATIPCGVKDGISHDDCMVTEIQPTWGGPYCFEIIDYQTNCCGLQTEGLTGNTDCDLADITLLIDHIFISHEDMCCLKNGNVNGDEQEILDLGDITRLIDYSYISHNETVVCQ